MATLYQGNGTDYLDYSINGKRLRKAVGNDRKKEEIYLGELHYKLSNDDIRPGRPEIPIGVFFDRFLENCKARLAEGTVIRHGNVIEHVRQFFTIHHPVQSVRKMLERGV